MPKFSEPDCELVPNTSKMQSQSNNTIEAQVYGWEVEFLAHAIELANEDIDYLERKRQVKNLTIYEVKTLKSALNFMRDVIGISYDRLKSMRNKYAIRRNIEHRLSKFRVVIKTW